MPTNTKQQLCIKPTGFLFILGIEVLALAICADPRIQGLEMQGKVKKLGLFADDGILALKMGQGYI